MHRGGVPHILLEGGRIVIPQLGVPELLIVLLIVIIFFGVGRLPELGGAIGKSIREFRKAMSDEGTGGETRALSEEKEEKAE